MRRAAFQLTTSVNLKFLCRQRVIWSPVWMDFQRHFVVAPPDVSLSRVFLDTQNLVQVRGLEKLLAPLEQTHAEQ